MSTQELALRPQNAIARASFTEMQSTAQMFVQSGMFQGIRDVAQAFVKIQAGSELGISPFASMKGIHIIQGSIAIGATLVAGRMKAWGYDWEEVQRDEKACALRIIKPTGKVAGTSSFTMEDAQRAGLTGKDNWKKFPKSMLFARCITDAARTWAPEVFAGMPVYTAEELGASNTNHDGEVIDVEPIRSREVQQTIRDRKVAEAEAKIAELTVSHPLANIKTAEEIDRELEPQSEPSLKKESKPKSDYQKMMDAIQALKAEFEELKATDRYYFVLGQHGFEKSNQIKKIDEGRNVYRDLLAELKVVRASTPIEGQDESPLVVA